MPSPHGSASTSLWASTRPPMSRSVPLTRSATRAAATRRTCGMDPVPSTPSSTSTTVRSIIRTCPAALIGRNSGSIRTPVRWHGLQRRPRSGTRASTASRSRRLALAGAAETLRSPCLPELSALTSAGCAVSPGSSAHLGDRHRRSRSRSS